MTHTTKAAPVGAGNTGPGAWTPLNLGEPVMPYPQSIQRYPEFTTPHAPSGVRPPAVDGCPECGAHDNQPHDVGYALYGYYATYTCACGHTWWTGWGYEPAGVIP